MFYVCVGWFGNFSYVRYDIALLGSPLQTWRPRRTMFEMGLNHVNVTIILFFSS